MIAKLVEIRDRHTMIPAIAVKCDPANAAEAFLLRRAGYGSDNVYVLLGKIDGSEMGDFAYDPFGHATAARTMREAHKWLIAHFDEIEPGAVVDVEFLLGESSDPKVSEAHA